MRGRCLCAAYACLKYAAMVTATELNKLKVEELTKLLKEKGLPATGKKADLVQVRALSTLAGGPEGPAAARDEHAGWRARGPRRRKGSIQTTHSLPADRSTCD